MPGFVRTIRHRVQQIAETKLLPSRRTLLAMGLVSAALLAVATMPQLLGSQVSKAIADLARAQPAWLWLAGGFFAVSLVCGSLSWRIACKSCGGSLDRVDATARFATGCLVNSFAPAKLGEAVRIILFSRRIRGEDKLWKAGGVFAAVAAARGVAQAVLVIAAFLAGALPLWPVFVLGGLVGGAALVAWVTRGRSAHSHVAHVLDAFRALGRCPREAARIIGWCTLSMGARVAAATAIGAALGIHGPLVAALIIIPALDIAALLPLTPGSIGITSGAVAVALQTRGVDLTTALSAGIALHAVETAASVVLGSAGVLLLARFPSPAIRRWTVASAGVAACLLLGAAFGATVLIDVF
jgi:uncharacterized membrane protein YbhN (UPF0104 family)